MTPRILALALLSACSTIGHTPAPADWPALHVVVERVPHAQMRDTCMRYVGALSSPEGCAVVYFDKRECLITISADYPSAHVLEHEREHCAGRDHPHESTLANAWTTYKKRKWTK